MDLTNNLVVANATHQADRLLAQEIAKFEIRALKAALAMQAMQAGQDSKRAALAALDGEFDCDAMALPAQFVVEALVMGARRTASKRVSDGYAKAAGAAAEVGAVLNPFTVAAATLDAAGWVASLLA